MNNSAWLFDQVRKHKFENGTEWVKCGCRVYRDDVQAQGIEFCEDHHRNRQQLVELHDAFIAAEEKWRVLSRAMNEMFGRAMILDKSR